MNNFLHYSVLAFIFDFNIVDLLMFYVPSFRQSWNITSSKILAEKYSEETFEFLLKKSILCVGNSHTANEM